MKTIAVIFVLSCMSLCLVNSVKVTKWGQTDTKVLGEKTVVVEPKEGQVQTATLEYPEVSISLQF